MDYPYELLDPERFQLFCQSLLAKEYASLQSFPVGQPDGGRDATSVAAGAKLREYTVFQVKFVRDGRNVDILKWVTGIVDAERHKIDRLHARGAARFVLVTNAQGTGHLDSGSIDRVQSVLNTLPMPALCLWRADLNSRLDGARDLKWVYPELMTGPDLLQSIIESGLTEHQERRSAAIRAFLSDQYARDEEVKFKQVELQNKLLDLFIDVPIVLSTYSGTTDPQASVAKSIRAAVSVLASLQNEQHNLGKQAAFTREHRYWQSENEGSSTVGAATLLLNEQSQRMLNRVVLEGAPGQGKSTITQYICQVHRMHLIDAGRVSVLPKHHQTISVRLPFRIDLRDLALWLERRDPFSPSSSSEAPAGWQKSLEAFLAAQVRHHSGGAEFSVSDLLAVAKLSSLLIVFDGLDEVAQMKRRQDVVDEIMEGIRRLDANALSLQVIVTSRPAAFVNSPRPPAATFANLTLARVSRALIHEYAEKWLRARNLTGAEASDVRRILEEKLSAPHFRDLARNPMQLAILLSLIHSRGVSLPDKRTALYDTYTELFFNRESEKSTVVRQHRELLIGIHRYLAWTLHAESESGRGAGSIQAEALERLLVDYLRQEGHPENLAKELFAGMVERVVAIVSRVQGTYEFEVQPLREYFAARHLYETAPYSPAGKECTGTKVERFAALSRNMYWLNVARFYAGCYSKGELPSLIQALEELREDEYFKYLGHPRALAAMLLSDWVFTQHPKLISHVVDIAADDIGVSCVLSTETGMLFHRPPLVLPKGAGRDEMVAFAIDALDPKAPHDVNANLLSFARHNGSGTDIGAMWLRRALKVRGHERSMWLSYGAELGLLHEIDEDVLIQLLSDGPLTCSRAAVLARAGRSDTLMRDDAWCEAGIQAVLSRSHLGTFEPNDSSVLEHLASVLSPSLPHFLFSELSERDGNSSLHEAIRRRSGETMLVHARDESDSSRALHGVWATISGQLDRPCTDWGSKVEPWSIVAEAVRSQWGENLATSLFANIAAGAILSDSGITEVDNLLDSASPLCSRVRYARTRRGASAWWKRQFRTAREDEEAELTALTLFTWAGPKTLAAVSPDFQQACERLPEPKWLRLFRAMTDALYTLSELGIHKVATINLSSPLLELTPRTLVALGLRCDEAARREIFESKLAAYRGDDRVVLSFCASEAMRSLMRRGANNSRRDLRIIKRAHAASADVGNYFAVLFRPARDRYLAQKVVAQVLASPKKYPSRLTLAAEHAYSAQGGSHVVPLLNVAKEQNWFDG